LIRLLGAALWLIAAIAPGEEAPRGHLLIIGGSHARSRDHGGPVVLYDATAAAVGRDADHGLRASGVTLHVLRRGARYDLAARRVARLSP
jgi:hypothetical protein